MEFLQLRHSTINLHDLKYHEFGYTVKAFILAGLKFGGFEYKAIWQDFILALRSFKIVI